MNLFIGAKFNSHDTAAYIINPETQDVFAMSTERITRYKHDYLYPVEVIKKYIERHNLDPYAIQNVYVGLPFEGNCRSKISPHFNQKEVLLRQNFDLKYIKDVQNFKNSFNFLKYFLSLTRLSGWELLINRLLKNLKINKLSTVNEEAKKHFEMLFPNAVVHVKCFNHSYCHAVSSYYSSNYDEATLITMDGSGDGAFSSAYTVRNGQFELISTSKFRSEISEAGSIGEIYSYFTGLLGFQPLADEGKVEALAAYGNHKNELYEKLMELVKLDRVSHELVMDVEKTKKLLNINNLQYYLDSMSKEDISAAVQKFLEDSTIPYYKHIINQTGITNLCLSGGVAANVIMNLNIFENVTKDIHIIPAMGDEGTAEGAAILMMYENGYKQQDIQWLKEASVPYFGSEYSNNEILNVLKDAKSIRYEYIEENWQNRIVDLLQKGKIGALFQGKMEWGPRALGNRSIIALTNDKDIRVKINKEIKKRPLFQPFCPSMLIEEKDRLFEHAYDNKHMTCAFRLKEEYYNDLPSAIHIDGTARVQFVSPTDNPNYYKLLKAVKDLTGFGVLINTSFNKHGRTIVETPQDALEDFLDTDLDFMMIGNYFVTRQ